MTNLLWNKIFIVSCTRLTNQITAYAEISLTVHDSA